MNSQPCREENLTFCNTNFVLFRPLSHCFLTAFSLLSHQRNFFLLFVKTFFGNDISMIIFSFNTRANSCLEKQCVKLSNKDILNLL